MKTNANSSCLPCAVAVLDTGIDPSRLRGGKVLPGINFTGVGEPEDWLDRNGHGSDIASSIASVFPKVSLLSVKVLVDEGYLPLGDCLEEAMEWIVSNHAEFGIKVVCASFSDASHAESDEPFRESRLHRAIVALKEQGIAVVAPSGNQQLESGWLSPYGMAWPAIMREVISVGAVEQIPGRAGRFRFLPHGQRLHSSKKEACQTTLMAVPGQPGNTSGAAAVVAGVLAKLCSFSSFSCIGDLIDCLLDRHTETMVLDDSLRWPVLTTTDDLAI